MSQFSNEANNDSKKMNVRQVFSMVLVGALIFAAGIGVGQGKLPSANHAASNQNSELPADLDYASVERVYDSLKANYDGELTADELLDGLKEGLAKATGDQYTEYFTPEEASDFNADLNGTFSGIGAELGKDKQNIVVIAPIAGFPAEKAGLKSRDIIAEIDGESAYDLSITEAVSKIRGPAGTPIKLKIVRDNTEVLDLEITREQIKIPSVEYEILEGNIGYLKISRFAEDTTELSRAAATEFKQKNVSGVILDMRSNPGGLLDGAVDVSSIWLEGGEKVLEEKRGDTVVKSFTAKGNPILKDVKTVVLINEGSASASEITAGALKDNNAATLIGTKTYGKGSVQSLVNLGDDSVLKVTIARWFTPEGKNIDKEGIEPDQKVERTDEDFEQDRDPQRQAAIDFLKK